MWICIFELYIFLHLNIEQISTADKNLAYELRYRKDTPDFDSLIQKECKILSLIILYWSFVEVITLWIKYFNQYSFNYSTNISWVFAMIRYYYINQDA